MPGMEDRMSPSPHSHLADQGASGHGEDRGGAPIANSRCVLWLHPNDTVPKPLLRSLSRRIEKTVFATDEYQALAEVMSLVRDGKRSGAPCPIVLLLMKPLRLSDAGEVLHQLDMYAPRVRRWRFDPSATPVFAPMSDADVAKLARAASRRAEDEDEGAGPGTPAETAVHGSRVVVAPAAASGMLERSGSGGGAGRGEGRSADVSHRRGMPSQASGPRFPSLGASPAGSAGRPLPKPRLRLVEADPSADTIVGTSVGGGTNFAQLTPEELQMLLSDAPAPKAPGPGVKNRSDRGDRA